MEQSPKVTIIIPAYNLEKYILTALKSVFNQTYSNYEVLLILDGCSDSTEKIVEQYLDDPRLHKIAIPRSGVSAARNLGMQLATGDIIAFLDGDDYWVESYLEKTVQRLLDAETDICYCDHSYVKKGIELKNQGNEHFPEGNILIEYVRGDVLIPTGSYIVRRDLLTRNKIRYVEGCTAGEDTEFRIKVFAVGKAAAVRESLHRIVIRGESATRSFNLVNFESAIDAYLRSAIYIREHVDDETIARESEIAIKRHSIPLRIAALMCAANYLGHGDEAIRYSFSRGLYKDLLMYRPYSSKDGATFIYYIIVGHSGPIGRIVGRIRQGHMPS